MDSTVHAAANDLAQAFSSQPSLLQPQMQHHHQHHQHAINGHPQEPFTPSPGANQHHAQNNHQQPINGHPQEPFTPSPGANQQIFPPLSSSNSNSNNVGPSPLQMLSDAAAAPLRKPGREDRSPSADGGAEIGVGENDPLRILFHKRFDTFIAAHRAAEEVAQLNGFALSIRSKRPTADNFNRAVLACSQGGKYRASHTAAPDRRRQTSTLKTGCTYKVAIKRNKLDKWFIEPVQGSQRDRHNHGSLSTGAFSRYRHRLVEEMRDDLIAMWEQGLKASVIRERLVDGRPECSAVTIHDVRNAMKRYEKERDPMGKMGGNGLNDRKWQNDTTSPCSPVQGERLPESQQPEHTQIDGLDPSIQVHGAHDHHLGIAHIVPTLPPHEHMEAAPLHSSAHFEPHPHQHHHLDHHDHDHQQQQQHKDVLQQHYQQVHEEEEQHLRINMPIDPAVTQERAEEANM